MLPALMGLTAVLIRVNTAMQISIVNQQYARAQALFLTFNSAVYPPLAQRMSFHETGDNQMVVGVAGNEIVDGAENEPLASEQNIARTKTSPKGDMEAQKEPDNRTQIRVRDTVTLCTQTNVISAGKPLLQIEGDKKNPIVAGQWNIGENSKFDYCRSGLKP
jgi:hypothetical protein